MRIFTLTLIIFLFISCGKKELKIEKVDFKTDYLFDSQIDQKVKADSTGRRLHFYATDYSFKGGFLKAQKIFDSIRPPKFKTLNQKQLDSLKSLYTEISAKKYLIEKSKDNRVIIINESHVTPYHRTFTSSLLKELYANGYRHLGLEAMNPLDTMLADRGFPTKKTGYYIKEPEFANMVRNALEIGFNVFGYEDFEAFEKGGEFREIGQAKNIKEVLDKNPNHKVIVHCGHQHASEGENNRIWDKAMARRLSDMTGINPLTINQTKYTEKSSSKLKNPFLQAFDFEEATVLLDKNGNPIPYVNNNDIMDIAIFHPLTKKVNKRPHWKFIDKENVNLTFPDIEIDFPVMIFAFSKNDDVSKAIPVDIIELQEKSTINLALKKGDHKLIIANKNEAYMFEHKVN